MAHKVKMPKFGETMTEGTIYNWLKEEGEEVKKGEAIFETETDKANLEVESPVDGILAQIIVEEDETVPIGKVVAIIADEGEDIGELLQETNEKKEKQSNPEKEETAGELKNCINKEKSKESKKSNYNGKIKSSPAAKRLARKNQLDLSSIQPGDNREVIIKDDVLDQMQKPKKATPVARKMAEELGIDLNKVNGTGPDGRIVRQDIEKYRDNLAFRIDADEVQEGSRTAELPLTGMRKTIARRMSRSSQEIPHVTLTTRVDMKEIVAMRNKLNDKSDIHITYTDILIMVIARGLQEYPQVNAHFKDNQIVKHTNVNIGIAVDIEEGLVVPVIKKAEKLGLADISRKSSELIEKAKDNKLDKKDMQGGTFTISNLGNLGIEIFTPIINQPETAIMGVGQIKEEAVAVNGKVTVRPVLWLSLSFDHRVIDGAPAAEFLQQIKKYLLKPCNLVL